MNLAQEFKQGGIQVGDVVELITEISQDFIELQGLLEGAEVYRFSVEGELIEVTGLFAQTITGYWLVGEAREDREGETYADLLWMRHGKQRVWGDERAFRKVGARSLPGADDDYTFLYPQLLNVWSRTQTC